MLTMQKPLIYVFLNALTHYIILENSFNDVSKAKVSIKNSGIVGSDQSASNYETYNNPRSNIGREIPFPEQEDSHFFFYFLSIVFIVMAGYLVFHNKQKVSKLICIYIVGLRKNYMHIFLNMFIVCFRSRVCVFYLRAFTLPCCIEKQ